MGRIIGLIIESPKLVCPVCGKEYKTEDGLNKHMDKEHAQGKEQNNE